MTDVLLANVWRLAAMAALLAISALVAAAETALFSLPRERLRRFRQSTVLGERLAPRLLDHPRSLLATLLFTNMLVNVTFFALAAGLAGNLVLAHHDLTAAAVGVAALLVVVVLGEIAPKNFAAAAPIPTARATAPLVYFLTKLLAPLRLVLDRLVVEPLVRLITGRRGRHTHGPFLTTAELQTLIDMASRESVVARDEGEMISEVLHLHATRVREVMVPRVDMVACDLATPTADVLALFRRTKMKKIIVYRGSPDDIVGVVAAREAFLQPQKPLGELIEPVRYVPEQTTVELLLRMFREKKIQLAIVVDEYGGTSGLITLADCIEEIVGDIPSEGEAPQTTMEKLSDTQFLLDGNLSMRAWSEYLETDLNTEMGVTTLNGFVMGLLGRLPHIGETCRYGNLRFTIQEVGCHPYGGPCTRASKILVEILHHDSAAGQRKASRLVGGRRREADGADGGPGL